MGKKKLTCDECGQEMWKWPNQINEGHNFCSRECVAEWNKTDRVTLTCEECGKKYEKLKSQTNDHDFCSYECYHEWQSRNIRGENHPKYNSVEVECAQCGKEFTVAKNRLQINNNFFCSYECHWKWLEGRYTGKDHHNWNGGGISYYGPSFSKNRKKVLERDNYTCQYCGATEDEIRLNCHHIIKFKKYRYPIFKGEVRNVLAEFNWKRANRVDNLITVCVECHNDVEGMSREEIKNNEP